jgi:hypothetical protein
MVTLSLTMKSYIILAPQILYVCMPLFRNYRPCLIRDHVVSCILFINTLAMITMITRDHILPMFLCSRPRTIVPCITPLSVIMSCTAIITEQHLPTPIYYAGITNGIVIRAWQTYREIQNLQ